jgi:predicted deacylase
VNLFNRTLKGGEKVTFRRKVTAFPDGTPISISVRAVVDVDERPMITLIGPQHGDEYDGIEIINRLVDWLDLD